MDEKYQKLIEQIASKIGTTAEHLFGILVRQAPISGTVDIILCSAIIVAVMWLVLFVSRKTTSRFKTEYKPYPKAEWNEEGAVLAWVITVSILSIAAVFIIGQVNDIVAAFANPEYWALKQLLMQIK